jgi:hypothetical protein
MELLGGELRLCQDQLPSMALLNAGQYMSPSQSKTTARETWPSFAGASKLDALSTAPTPITQWASICSNLTYDPRSGSWGLHSVAESVD